MYDTFKEIKGNVKHMSEGQKYVLKILYIYIKSEGQIWLGTKHDFWK